MTIRAAVAYLSCVEAPLDPEGNSVVEDASRAGYAFDVKELRRVIAARDLLARVHEDEALRNDLIEAVRPGVALIGLARSVGSEADEEALLAVLQALRAPMGELDTDALEGVAGGVYNLPELEDEVLVVFLKGAARSPVVIGSLWNTRDTPGGGS